MLAVAMFLDAPWIRMIILPVVIPLTGQAACHTPRWLQRVLPDVKLSH